MESNTSGELIVLVTDARSASSDVTDEIRNRTGMSVRSVSVADLDDRLEDAVPDAIVLSADDPEIVRTTVTRIQEDVPDAPSSSLPATEARSCDGSDQGRCDRLRSGRRPRLIDRIVDSVQTTGERDRNVEFRRILAEELPDEAFVIGEDGTYLEAKVRPESAELYETTAAELVGTTIGEAFPEPTAERLLTVSSERSGPTRYSRSSTTSRRLTNISGTKPGRPDRSQNRRTASCRVARTRYHRTGETRTGTPARQAELETLNRINAVVRRVIETLVEAPSRNAIEREVCRQLVDSELYCGSWIAEWTGDGLAYRTGAGDATTYLECVQEGTSGPDRPFRRAVRSAEIQTEDHVLEREPLPDLLQTAAADDDVEAVVAVPITHEDATYGALTVLASRDDAFSESERAGFELLGETIGFTIMAVKTASCCLPIPSSNSSFASMAARRFRSTSHGSTTAPVRSSGRGRLRTGGRSSSSRSTVSTGRRYSRRQTTTARSRSVGSSTTESAAVRSRCG